MPVTSCSSGVNTSTALTNASQQKYEGHNCYRTDQLDVNVSGTNSAVGNDGGYWLTDNPGVQPNYILLHTGTNDIDGAYKRANSNPTDAQLALDAVGRLETLLNDIIAARPNTHIFVAGIIPIRSSAESVTQTLLYDNEIKSVILTDSAYTGKVTYVDQYDSFLNSDGSINTSIYADNLHPNDLGYVVMAQTWFNAINAYPGPAIAIQPASQNVTTATFSVLTTGSGTGALTYRWCQGSTAILGATGSSYTIATTTSASAGSYYVVVSNTAGSVSSATATLTLREPLTNFLSSYGLPESATTLDTDSDGIVNLLEFVLGGNPLVSDSGSILPTSTQNASGTLVLTFNVPANLGSVTWTVELSSDLSNWTAAVSGQNGVQISSTAATFTANHVVVTILGGGRRLFARLRATLP